LPDRVRLEVRELRFLDKGPYSFAVAAGECLGISGRSGIGKSQLFRAITDLIPSAGQILLDGQESASFPAPTWRRLVTMVPAESFWWYDTVGPHFTGMNSGDGLAGDLAALGLEPDALGWEITRLSTGERQRLALLRSLQQRPKVLLLDEPSSALDAHHTQLLESFIGEFRRSTGAAVVWVSHDPEQLRRVGERILRMESDRLEEIVALTGKG
jgi:ABC-type iron transport system FetAB ATPase subunit